jgi:glycosyltransferase involved in cell wall biosynthesis
MRACWRRPRHSRRIVLAVTASQSLKLMRGFPEHLAAGGWDVHVVATSAPSDPYPAGVTFHSLPMVREPSPLRDILAFGAWLVLLLRLKPSIVVAGTPKAGLLGTLAAFVLRVPARVYLLRGLRLETEQGLKRRLLHVLEWTTARTATAVLAVSDSLRDEFVSLGLSEAERVTVLGAGSSNGVAITPWPSAPDRERARISPIESLPQLTPTSPTVGFVGRLARDKGLPTLLEAIGQLQRAGVPVQLLLVGSEEPAGSLEMALTVAGLDSADVCWAGPVDDVTPYYWRMDVLCLPTRREGFPNVVLEAAMAGLPTVVSKVTGGVDSVVDGETGLWFEVGNSEDLARRLAEVLSDDRWRKLLGEQARTRAVEQFDRQIVWSLTEDFFSKQIEQREQATCES